MSVLYLETSAVLAWLLGEPQADDVRTTINGADTIVASVLTPLECERVLVRAETDSTLKAREAQSLRGLLRRAVAGWMLMELTASVRERAGRAFPVEPVRTLDALHLATALEFSTAFADLEVLSLDRRILSNAEPLGLPTSTA